MIIFAGLIVLLCVGILLTTTDDTSFTWILGVIIIVSCVIGLVASGICFPLNRLEVRARICEMQAVRQTVETARTLREDSVLENAAIQHKIAEQNAWLAREKYLKGTLFSAWIPDEIMAVEPIK